jgi:ABC-type proline/glycine betaine transport system substrate-binding protein
VRRPDYFVMDDDPQPETNYRKWVRDNPDLVDKYVREKLQPK